MTNPWDEQKPPPPPSQQLKPNITPTNKVFPKAKSGPKPVTKEQTWIVIIIGVIIFIILGKAVSNKDQIANPSSSSATSAPPAKSIDSAELGFNPQTACNYLTDMGAVTGSYAPMVDGSGSYLCASPYQQLGDPNSIPMQNTVSYYARGNANSVYRLRILLNVNNPADEMEGRLTLAVMAARLTDRALNIKMPEEAAAALQQGNSYLGKRNQFDIYVIHENWENGNGYSLEYVIQDPAFSEDKTAVLASSSVAAAPQNNAVIIPDTSLNTLIKHFYTSSDSLALRKEYPKIKNVFMRQYNVEYEKELIEKNRIESLKLIKKIIYKNSAGQQRYLVIVEGSGYTENVDGSITMDTCHACSPATDIYLFERLKNNKFKLITKSEIENPIFIGSNGVSEFVTNKNIKLEDISPFDKGFFINVEYSTMGEASEGIIPIAIIENLPIVKSDYIGLSVISGGGVDESMDYGFTSKKIINKLKITNGFYPIEVTSKGDNYDESYDKIVPYNIKRVYSINSNKYTLD